MPAAAGASRARRKCRDLPLKCRLLVGQLENHSSLLNHSGRPRPSYGRGISGEMHMARSRRPWPAACSRSPTSPVGTIAAVST